MTERLLCDAMLGTLATHLRMCGHDTAFVLEEGLDGGDDIRAYAKTEERRLLTRNRRLARTTDDAILLESTDLDEQLATVAEHGIPLELDDPSRCSRCNGELDRLPESHSTPTDAPNPDEEAIWECAGCGQYYWKGSHWDNVRERLEAI